MKIITVLIPFYNREAYLKENIDSVLRQSFPDFELFALDDGSTDNGAAIIQSYADPRIKYIPCTHDYVGTLNKGIELCESEYIALIDSDDIMQPDRLQIQYDFMESHRDIAVCGGYMQAFGMNTVSCKISLTYIEILKDFLLYSPMLNPTCFIRRKILMDNHIRYQYGYNYSIDYKLWSDIAKVGKLENIPEVLTLYRTHPEQVSKKYIGQCMEGGRKVKFEMLEYFLSLLKKDNEIALIVKKDLIPAMDNLGEMGITFREKSFFNFMYELINGLLNKGVIEIPH